MRPPPVLDLLGVEARRGVQDGDPVGHQLAVRDHRELHGLDALGVTRAALVRGHQVGHAQHGDLVDGLEPGEAGPVGGVADVGVRLDLDRHGPGAPSAISPAAARDSACPWSPRRRSASTAGDRGGHVVRAALGGDVVERLDGLPPRLTTSLKVSSAASQAGATSTARSPASAERAETVRPAWSSVPRPAVRQPAARPAVARSVRRPRRRPAPRTRCRRRSGSSRTRRARGSSPR